MVGKYLTDIALDLIEEQQGESAHDLKRYISFGIKGIRQLHMKFKGAPAFDLISINFDTQTIKIPSDCIRIIGVSQLDAQNRPIPLQIKDGIVLNDNPSMGYSQRSYEGLFSHLYGANPLSGAGYNINHHNQTIKISTEVKTDCLWVEYLADIKKIDGQYLVHPYDEEAILAYMYYLSIRNNPNYAVSEKQEAERRYEKEFKSSRRMNKTQPIQDIITDYRSTYSGTVKG